MTPSKRPYSGTQSVRRALALLKAFSDVRPEWGLTGIARHAGLNKTTAYRLLTALEAEGMVAWNADTETWRLGNQAIVLGARAVRSNDLVGAARPELEALVRDTGETATLEVLVGTDVEILDGVESPSVVGASSEIGTRWPAHATSTGKVLLAALLAETGRGSGRRGGALGPAGRRLRRFTPRTIVDPVRLERELGRAAQRGWATAIEELEAGYVAVGAPIRDHSGRTVAAVSVGGPATRLTKGRVQDLTGRVVRTADRVSRRLGEPRAPLETVTRT